MKKLTKIQILTIILLLLYFVWEIYAYMWSKNITGPVIRVDLIIIYPVLFVTFCISIFQVYKRKKQ